MAQRDVVTLLSGGIDSMVLADSLRQQKGVRQNFIFVDYGQVAMQREYASARSYATDKGNLNKVSIRIHGLALKSQLLTGHLREPAFLPGRNLLLLVAGAWRACQIRTSFVAIGLRETSQFPDTSEFFIRGFSAMAYQAFGQTIEVIAPLLHLGKAAVVQLGREYGTPISLSYSCYLGRKRPCGRCLGCRDRKGLI